MLKEQIKNKSNELLEDTIKEIQRLVKVKSVRDEAGIKENLPFGNDVDNALNEFVKMADEKGFRTYKDSKGYYAYAEVGPETGKLIGILGHVDVVPEGDEKLWTEGNPFDANIVDEKIIGRGSLDDKGPVVINMMAIKLLMDLNYEFKSRVRIIVGGSEETTWECIDKYKEEQEIPTISYSPDSNFPLINAEKTVFQFTCSHSIDCPFTVIGGNAFNAVPDSCEYIGPNIDDVCKELDKLGYEYKKTDEGIITLGKAAHAMECYKGINAVTNMAEALFNADIHSETIDFIAKYIKDTKHGELIYNPLIEDNVSGKLTLNVGKINIQNNKEEISCDMRVPVLANFDEVKEQIKTIVQANGLEFDEASILEKLYVDEKSFLVSTLLNVYKDVTNDVDAKPLSSGGATYSRAWDNCVAFGMVFRKQGMIDKMHQANECLELKYIQPALEIYANAIYQLDQE